MSDTPRERGRQQGSQTNRRPAPSPRCIGRNTRIEHSGARTHRWETRQWPRVDEQGGPAGHTLVTKGPPGQRAHTEPAPLRRPREGHGLAGRDGPAEQTPSEGHGLSPTRTPHMGRVGAGVGQAVGESQHHRREERSRTVSASGATPQPAETRLYSWDTRGERRRSRRSSRAAASWLRLDLTAAEGGPAGLSCQHGASRSRGARGQPGRTLTGRKGHEQGDGKGRWAADTGSEEQDKTTHPSPPSAAKRPARSGSEERACSGRAA